MNKTSIIKEHQAYRYQLPRLVFFDLSRQYRDAFLGLAWAIIHPLLQLFMYWFVMKIGLRAQVSKEGIDLFPWLAVGSVVWFYVSDVVSKSVTSFKTYKYIITKMKFPISIIPTITVLSNLITHLALLSLVFLFLAIDGSASIYWLQLPFYTLLLVIFAYFWNLFAAPLGAISKDFNQLVKSIMRVLFWLSGVIYNVNTIEIEWLKNFMKINPITFFIEGYRNTLLYGRWFWEDWKSLIAFAITFAIIIFLGIRTFKRTRKEIADVL